jgi:general stress protein CsbA
MQKNTAAIMPYALSVMFAFITRTHRVSASLTVTDGVYSDLAVSADITKAQQGFFDLQNFG